MAVRGNGPRPAGWPQDHGAEPGAGNIEAILSAARQYPLTGIKAAGLDTKAGYFEHNAHRVRYQPFREPGTVTGSGHLQAGRQAIAAQRATQAGMQRATSGAAGITAPRCQHASGRRGELPTTQAPIPAGPPAASRQTRPHRPAGHSHQQGHSQQS